MTYYENALKYYWNTMECNEIRWQYHGIQLEHDERQWEYYEIQWACNAIQCKHDERLWKYNKRPLSYKEIQRHPMTYYENTMTYN